MGAAIGKPSGAGAGRGLRREVPSTQPRGDRGAASRTLAKAAALRGPQVSGFIQILLLSANAFVSPQLSVYSMHLAVLPSPMPTSRGIDPIFSRSTGLDSRALPAK